MSGFVVSHLEGIGVACGLNREQSVSHINNHETFLQGI